MNSDARRHRVLSAAWLPITSRSHMEEGRRIERRALIGPPRFSGPLAGLPAVPSELSSGRSPRAESNRLPADYETAALPTELLGRGSEARYRTASDAFKARLLTFRFLGSSPRSESN